MSIRLRLTLLYVMLLAIMLAVFSSFVYVLFERNLVEEIDGSLDDRANEMIRFLSQAQIGVLSPRLPTIDAFASSEIFIQLLDSEGNILDRSTNLGRLRIPVDHAALQRVAGGGADFGTFQAERTTLRVFTLPIRVNGTVFWYIQVARSLDELDLTMRRLRQVLVVGSGLTTIVAFALGSMIATRALRPIDRITLTARRIEVSGNLAERVAYRGPRDEIGRLAATFNDMLDRLAYAYHQIEAALAAQRRFVADASHELRTPLTTIRGNLDLLIRHPDLAPLDRSEALTDAAGEARRMSRLVEDLLFLARADAGQRLQKAPIAAELVVHEVIRQARRLAKDGQTIVEGPVDPATIVASADHFKQLLLILIDNAIKYTPPGGTIEIRSQISGDPAILTVEVADSGPGIPTEVQQHIFERFYRADTAREGEGAGLGLAIARWLAEEHGGRIDVTSTPGEGSVFTVWLPAEPVVFTEPDPALTEELTPAIATAR